MRDGRGIHTIAVFKALGTSPDRPNSSKSPDDDFDYAWGLCKVAIRIRTSLIVTQPTKESSSSLVAVAYVKLEI